MPCGSVSVIHLVWLDILLYSNLPASRLGNGLARASSVRRAQLDVFAPRPRLSVEGGAFGVGFSPKVGSMSSSYHAAIRTGSLSAGLQQQPAQPDKTDIPPGRPMLTGSRPGSLSRWPWERTAWRLPRSDETGYRAGHGSVSPSNRGNSRRVGAGASSVAPAGGGNRNSEAGSCCLYRSKASGRLRTA